jgi:two-component system response regulator LytT
MLKIAVLDDEPIFHDNIRRKIYSIYDEIHMAVNVDCYSSGKALMYEVEDGKYYDIYLLDIELPDISGIDLGRVLREKSPYCYIIFLTAYPQFAIEGYSAKAYQYILKDEWEQKLAVTLENIQKEITARTEPSYRIAISTKLEKIPVKDIYYIYKDGKNVVFQTRNGRSSIRKTLSVVYEELPEEGFIYVDRGFIVNVEHVMKLKNREIYMSNGEIVPVSKPQLERVKKEINAYWRSHV